MIISIGDKLRVLLFVLILPILGLSLVGLSVINQRLDQLRGAETGLKLIEGVWSSAHALMNETGMDETVLAVWPIGEAPNVLSQSSVDTILRQQDRFNTPTATRETRLMAANTIILEIARSTNLTIPPEGFTPGYASILFERLPEVSYRLAVLESLVLRLQQKPELNFNDQMAFTVNAGQFKAAADATSRISKLPSGAPDPILENLVEDAGSGFRQSNLAFQSAAVRTLKSIEKFRAGPKIEVEELLGSKRGFDAAIETHWDQSFTALRLKLDATAAEWRQSYWFVVSIFVIAITASLTVASLLRRSILHQAEELRVALSELDIKNERLAELNREAEYRADHDPLTGLANRRALQRELGRRLEGFDAEKPGIVAMHIDLDLFKEINDTMGHAAGDHVLKHVARTLCELSSKHDIVARVGGDEYLIIRTEDGSLARAEELARQIVTQLSIPIQFQNEVCQFGASIGIAHAKMGDENVDIERLLSDADIALYQAKELGRGRYAIFSDILRAKVTRIKALSDELQLAVREGSLQPYYQPQVDAVSNEVIGVEVLVRWPCAAGEVLTPAHFLPIAERLGLVASIDTMMLEQAIADALNIHSRGLILPKVSFNIGIQTFRETAFWEKLGQHRSFPSQISVEVAEDFCTSLCKEELAFFFDQLDEMNVGVEIGDFGAGYSSFQSMYEVRPKLIKISKTLCDFLEQSEAHMEIVRAIIHVSKKLGVDVLAEGVEDLKTSNILAELGCTKQQGYFFAKPMRFDELGIWLSDFRDAQINVASSQ